MAADIDIHLPVRQINVLVVIDTEYVKRVYGPNENTEQPQQIAHEGQFMLSTGSRATVHGQGTGGLRLRARAGDQVAIRVTSICSNAADAVIPYCVGQASGTRVFAHFEQVFLAREEAVRPDPDSPGHNGLPPIERPADFTSFDSIVVARGTERLEIAFALYVLSSNGQRQDLFGYYAWNPIISIA